MFIGRTSDDVATTFEALKYVLKVSQFPFPPKWFSYSCVTEKAPEVVAEASEGDHCIVRISPVMFLNSNYQRNG